MASKASLIAKAFGRGGAFSPIADKTLSASDRKLTGDALGSGASGQQVVANINALIALSGMNSGDTVLVSSNNKLYLWNGSGWYIIATVVNRSEYELHTCPSSVFFFLLRLPIFSPKGNIPVLDYRLYSI